MLTFVASHQFGITICIQVALVLIGLWSLVQWYLNRKEDLYQATHEFTMFILCTAGVIRSFFCSFNWLMFAFAVMLVPVWFHDVRWIIWTFKRKNYCKTEIIADSISVFLKFGLSVFLAILAYCI